MSSSGGTIMYESFYGLSQRPFLTLPDPDFLFWSDSHVMAFTMLRYGVMTRAPITVITGDVGAGKTTLLRKLLREVPEEVTTGLISNMQDGRGELLHWVMMALEQPFDANEPYVTLFKRFQDFVIEAYAANRRVLLIFDEAQNMGAKSLEELRMLSNINSEKDELLQIILVGQPELRELIMRPELRQFSQRISSDFNLGPLSKPETAKYIRRRLAIAGATTEIFPERTCELIHEATGGVPRLINILCDFCLLYGFSAERRVIDEDLLNEFLESAKVRGIYNQFAAPRPIPKLVSEK
ncbi:ExeA family protein [Pikeienuella piscinae]|nr:AAA family ATPase [Pikeienuella piscinae]